MNTVLVVAAHPDDEVLGCGGTIAKHVDEGDMVYIIFMADGVTSRGVKDDFIDKRNLSAVEASQQLGAQTPYFLGFPDNRMDTVALLDVVQKLESHIEKLKPSIIYTHHFGDLNIDHRITHQAVLTACRPQPDFCVKEIYTFEVLSSTEWQSPYVNSFSPSMFVDVSKYMNKKMDALKSYESEMRPYPHSRSYKNVESLAIYRGASVGVECAEAYEVVRVLIV